MQTGTYSIGCSPRRARNAQFSGLLTGLDFGTKIEHNKNTPRTKESVMVRMILADVTELVSLAAFMGLIAIIARGLGAH